MDKTTAALIRQAEASGHSLFAPSAAHRWMTCPASLLAALRAKADLIDEDGTPVTGSNVYSVEGTAAHEVAQRWLLDEAPPIEMKDMGFTRDGITVDVTQELFDFVEQYVEWVWDLSAYGRQGVEIRVDLSDLFPVANQGGTADHLHYDTKTGTLTITDLKYGQGVQVFAFRNFQLMLYAIGAIRWLYENHPPVGITKIVLRIAQPRLDHFDTYELDLIELQHFAHEVRLKAKQALSPDAPYNPDPKACRFCPAKATCRVLKESTERMAQARFAAQPDETFDASPEAIAATLTTEEMAAALRWRKTVETWFSAVEAELFKRADAGLDVPGYKIAEGRRSRKWRDATTAAEMLEVMGLEPDEIFSRVMLSPAQAERVLGAKRLAPKKVLGPLLEIISGPRTLAPLVDPRSALAGSSAKFGPVYEAGLDDLS